MNTVTDFGIIPIDYSILNGILNTYKSPKDKVVDMVRNKELIRLKKGLFVGSPKINKLPISKELVANHLYGPSYLSLESALSIYGLIPERVHSIRSITVKRSKKFTNNLGFFDYTHVTNAYFEIGIQFKIVNDQFAYLIASPEKALCDMIIATPKLRIQSARAMQCYLEEDLRLDFTSINTFDIDIVRQCMEVGKNKLELGNLINFMKSC